MIERELRALLNRHPFEPFRIKLVNGDGHDVVYADLVALLEEGVYITSEGRHWAQFPFDRIASFESSCPTSKPVFPRPGIPLVILLT